MESRSIMIMYIIRNIVPEAQCGCKTDWLGCVSLLPSWAKYSINTLLHRLPSGSKRSGRQQCGRAARICKGKPLLQ